MRFVYLRVKNGHSLNLYDCSLCIIFNLLFCILGRIFSLVLIPLSVLPWFVPWSSPSAATSYLYTISPTHPKKEKYGKIINYSWLFSLFTFLEFAHPVLICIDDDRGLWWKDRQQACRYIQHGLTPPDRSQFWTNPTDPLPILRFDWNQDFHRNFEFVVISFNQIVVQTLIEAK